MVYSPRQNPRPQQEDSRPNSPGAMDDQYGHNEMPPADYYNYADDQYAGYPDSNEDNHQFYHDDSFHDAPAPTGNAYSARNSTPNANQPSQGTPTSNGFTRNKAVTRPVGNSSPAPAPVASTPAPVQQDTSAPTSRFTRNRAVTRPVGTPASTVNNDNQSNNVRPAQPAQSHNETPAPAANFNNPGQGTSRFNQSSYSQFNGNNNSQPRGTSASEALTNFKPASSPYQRSEPSNAYQAKVDARDMNMRLAYWGDAKKASANQLHSYPQDKIVRLSKFAARPNTNANASPAPAQIDNGYQPLPPRARSGFDQALEIPETTPVRSPSAMPQRGAYGKPSAPQQPAPVESPIQSAPIPEPIIVKDDMELAEELFNTKNAAHKNNDHHMKKTSRFLSLGIMAVNVKASELSEAHSVVVSDIDSQQKFLNDEFIRLHPGVPLVAEKKTRKKKTDSEVTDAAVENNAESTSSSVDVKPITRAKNKNFHPKSTASVESFQTNDSKFEGEDINNLEKSAVSTKELLDISNIQLSQSIKFNTQELTAIPPEVLLHFLGAKPLETEKENEKGLLVLGEQVFDINSGSNKWFNTTLRRGSTGTINLMKHLIANENGIVEQENNSQLFKAACMKLTTLLPEINAFVSKSNEDDQAKKKRETQAFYKAIDMIPLEDIMNFVGARNNYKGARGRWKVPQNGHVYAINKGWHSFTSSEGGGGAIGLFSHIIAEENNLYWSNPDDKLKLFKIAVTTLKKAFEQEINLNINVDFDNMPYQHSYSDPFYMPIVIPFKQTSVANYLHQKRGIPNWLINKQMAAGSLFPGFPSDWKRKNDIQFNDTLEDKNVWAVFLGANANAAEMRGIDRYDGVAKLQAKGSAKEHGGHVVKAEKDFQEYTVCSFEAAIDALSYHALYPGRTTQSCMGVNYQLAVKIATEALDSGCTYNLCFDNDLAGNINTLRFKEALIHYIGEEDYNEYYSKGKINYFELGINCYNEQISNGMPYYLDIAFDEDGKETFKMFTQELLRYYERDDVMKDMQDHKFYVYNITPKFSLLRESDIPQIAKSLAEQFTNDSKPYYFLTEPPALEISDMDNETEIEEKKADFEEDTKKYNTFMHFFKEEIGDTKWKSLEARGAIIKKIPSYAKDWNEFMIKEVKNKPEIANAFTERENFFKEKYTSDINIAEVAGRLKRKP